MTITKEWLRQTISELEQERNATPGVVNEDAVMALEAMRIALASIEAEAVAPDDVSGPLAYAYKELTPTFMRNHIEVFERYGIYPDGSAGIQAMRIALDGMNRRAAMLQGAHGNSTVILDELCPCCGRKQLKNRKCSVAGCEGKHVAHGFCKKHYDIDHKKDPSRRDSI
ncbi:hypothetical protein ACQ4LJ_19990, partial [Huaxiibacter chinensis]